MSMKVLFVMVFYLLEGQSHAQSPQDPVNLANETASNLSAISSLVKGALGQNQLGELIYYSVGSLCFQVGRAGEALKVLRGETEDLQSLEDYCSTPMTAESSISLSKLAQKIAQEIRDQKYPSPVHLPELATFADAPSYDSLCPTTPQKIIVVVKQQEKPRHHVQETKSKKPQKPKAFPIEADRERDYTAHQSGGH
jgi:hypothetical protein